MMIRIRSTFIEYLLWILIIGFLFWNVFIAVLVLNPFGLIPITLVICAAVLLYLKHEYLTMALQLWAIYLVFSSGLKLLASYMDAAGSIGYDWSTLSIYRNLFFLVLAGFLVYVSLRQVEFDERF